MELRARLALGRARAVEGLGDRFEALEAELRASLVTYPAQVVPARPTAPRRASRSPSTTRCATRPRSSSARSRR